MATGLAVVSSSAEALADFSADWSPPPIQVTLESDVPNTPLALYHPEARIGRHQPYLVCNQPCYAEIPAGRYKLHVLETENTRSGTTRVDLYGPAQVIVEPDDFQQMRVGLALGIIGPIAIAAGGLLLAVSVYCSDYDYESDGRSNGGGGCGRGIAAGATIFVGGLVMTPVGWVMFARGLKPKARVYPIVHQPEPNFQLGVAPTKDGLQAAGAWRF